MCVNLTMYPLVKLTNGKKKVIFNQGIVIENKDFISLNTQELECHLAVKGNSRIESLNRVFKKNGVESFEKFVNVPCGHCEQCLKSKARGWAFRILKEAEQHESNYFITLTYNDDNLKYAPLAYTRNAPIASLVKNEISVFNKKLKTYLKRKGLKSDFRFYGVGEYGSNTFRPHYHVIYFGLEIPDLEFYKYENGQLYFTSKFIQDVWSCVVEDPETHKNVLQPKGHVVIGALDIGSACYVARYCDKKLERTKQEKEFISSFGIIPEFSVMSRNPGIAADYMFKIIDNFNHGVYKLSSNGNDFSIPLYYSKKIKDLLEPKVKADYEARCDLLIRNKISNDILLADIMQTSDLQEYYLREDLYKKSLKKERDNIKYN